MLMISLKTWYLEGNFMEHLLKHMKLDNMMTREDHDLSPTAHQGDTKKMSFKAMSVDFRENE